MRSRQSRIDEILFLSAFLAVLVGLAFLFRTTGLAKNFIYIIPLVIAAAGGLLLYIALLRGGKRLIFLMSLILLGWSGLILASILAGWSFRMVWPLLAVVVGLSWFAMGLRERKRLRASFAVPSIAFMLLGSFLSLFSFRIVGKSLGAFMVDWWPIFIIAGGIALFGAYGASRRHRGRTEP